VVSAAPEPPPAPSFALRGRVLGHDGKPMKLARLQIAGGEPSPIADDGAFRIVREGPGFLSVRVAGVDHAHHVFGLFVDAGEQDVEIRLGTYERSDGAGASLVILSGAEGQRLAHLKKGEGGVLTAEVDADGTPLVYQIVNLFQGRQANGPEADGFTYDGDGDFRSVLHPQKGKLTLHVDPSKLPPAGARAEISFADPASRAARIDRLHEDAQRRAEDAGRGRPADPSFRAPLAATLGAERDPDVLAALRIAYLVPPPPPGSDEAAAVARALLDTLAPGAPLWAFWPEAALTAVGLAPRGAAGDRYLDALVDGLHDRDAAAQLLHARILSASSTGREDELARLFPILKQRFGGTAPAAEAAFLDPARRIRPGRPIPDFALPSLSGPTGPGRRVTAAGLRGKVVLIDLWGTWCGPCREEMQYLTRAFEAHRDAGFTIVSIAAHEKVEQVQRFRATLWKMPWTNVVLDDKNEKATLELFENQSFPEPILVDGDGKILAVGEAVRGESLEPAIARALAANAKAGSGGRH
jgi:thiol-disulfide isomerase/thioredoxin